MNQPDSLGKVIAEQTQRITSEQGLAWERVLRLYIRPKPAWMAEALWKKIVNLVVVQSVETRR